MFDPLLFRKIIVVGANGSGKTTIAQNLSGFLGLPHVELDALQWEPNWRGAPPEIFAQRVRDAVKGSGWIVDGNYYSQVNEIVWPLADTVIWLDLDFHIIFWRILCRTFKRYFHQEILWSGNKESLSSIFSPQNSIILWTIKSFSSKRRRYAELIQDWHYTHITFIHLKTPKEIQQFLQNLSALYSGQQEN